MQDTQHFKEQFTVNDIFRHDIYWLQREAANLTDLLFK